MELQHPVCSLVPSLDWAVLEVLVATQSSLGVSQIARLSSSGSRKGHAAVLDRLVNHGLVIAQPAHPDRECSQRGQPCAPAGRPRPEELMSPQKLQTKRTQSGEGRGRRQVAEKYLEVASLIDSDDGAAINVRVGVAVRAGIAASDAICAAALGERYSGQDHETAADLLGRVDPKFAKLLRSVAVERIGARVGLVPAEVLLTLDEAIRLHLALIWIAGVQRQPRCARRGGNQHVDSSSALRVAAGADDCGVDTAVCAGGFGVERQRIKGGLSALKPVLPTCPSGHRRGAIRER